MKKFILVLVVGLFAAGALAQAADVKVWRAVVDSQVVRDYTHPADDSSPWQLVKIQQTAVYRCPQCYSFALHFERYGIDDDLQRRVVMVGTRLRINDGPGSTIAVEEVRMTQEIAPSGE